MTDLKLSETADMVLDFLSLVRNNLFIEADFIKTFPACSKEFQENFSPTSLPPSHIKVILYLAKYKSSPISHIAKKLNISKSNMTPIIDKLIELNLVNRFSDNKDRRILRVELTSKAIELFNHMESVVRDSIKKKISSLSDDDLDNLSDSLRSISSILNKIT